MSLVLPDAIRTVPEIAPSSLADPDMMLMSPLLAFCPVDDEAMTTSPLVKPPDPDRSNRSPPWTWDWPAEMLIDPPIESRPLPLASPALIKTLPPLPGRPPKAVSEE